MVLKKGSKGNDVKTVQKALNLVDDGIYGTVTEEAVKAFQKANGLVVDGIVGDKTMSLLLKVNNGYTIATSLKQGDNVPVMPDGSYKLTKTTRSVNNIILHCTATPEGKDYTISQIKKWHQAKGWSDVAYHYVIGLNGNIMIGRDINKIGAHCQGHNTGSIGISYIGGCPANTVTKAKDTRTAEQRIALKNLVKQLMKMYNLKSSQVHGHCEYANKACPSFDPAVFRREL